MIAVLKLGLGLFRKSRGGRTERTALNGGGVGDSTKERNDRVPLTVDDGSNKVERRYTLQMAYQMSLGEKARKVMDAVAKYGGCDFEVRAAKCLRDAKTVSTTTTEVVLPDGSRQPRVSEDHLYGKTQEAVDENKKWIKGVVEGLESDPDEPITCADWCRFSVVATLGCLNNSACLRTKPALGLSAPTSYLKQYAVLGSDKQEWRLLMRPPPKEKATSKQNRKLDKVQKEHEIHGADVVRWCTVMNLIGREFLRKHNGSVDYRFGPLKADGTKMSNDTFGRIFEIVMRSYFGVDNADVYALRTTQDSLAGEDLLAAGESTDHAALGELCREQRTDKDVSEVRGILKAMDTILGVPMLLRVLSVR